MIVAYAAPETPMPNFAMKRHIVKHGCYHKEQCNGDVAVSLIKNICGSVQQVHKGLDEEYACHGKHCRYRQTDDYSSRYRAAHLNVIACAVVPCGYY